MPADELKGILWQISAVQFKFPETRPLNDSYVSVGGFDIARLEYDEYSEKLLYFREEAGKLWDKSDDYQFDQKRAGLDVGINWMNFNLIKKELGWMWGDGLVWESPLRYGHGLAVKMHDT